MPWEHYSENPPNEEWRYSLRDPHGGFWVAVITRPPHGPQWSYRLEDPDGNVIQSDADVSADPSFLRTRVETLLRNNPEVRRAMGTEDVCPPCQARCQARHPGNGKAAREVLSLRKVWDKVDPRDQARLQSIQAKIDRGVPLTSEDRSEVDTAHDVYVLPIDDEDEG